MLFILPENDNTKSWVLSPSSEINTIKKAIKKVDKHSIKSPKKTYVEVYKIFVRKINKKNNIYEK